MVETPDEATLNALKAIMKDTKKFDAVVSTIFDQIDTDKSGSISNTEMEKFIASVLVDFGIKKEKGPDKKQIEAVFNELDEDKSKTISKEELKKFVKTLFGEHVKQLENKIAAKKK